MITKRLQTAYDRIAAQYATINALMPPEVAIKADRFSRLIGPHGLMLDVGCGPGRDLDWFKDKEIPAVGLDLSAGMLAEARRQAPGNLIQMDMRTLGFQSACFQGVWCNASLLHLAKHEARRAIAEIHRVLRRGGVLFLSVQSGAGEAWEPWAYDGTVKRLFARYHPIEMAMLLVNSGFIIHEYTIHQHGSRCWLHFLAIAVSHSEKEKTYDTGSVDRPVGR